MLCGKLGAPGKSSECRGRGHHFQQIAPVKSCTRVIGPVREFIFEVVAKFGRISKLIEATPKTPGVPIVLCMPKRCDIYVGPSVVLVFYLHKDSGPYRWHVVQFVSFCTLYSFMSWRPKVNWLLGAW